VLKQLLDFQMFALMLDGLDDAMRELTRKNYV